MKSNICILIYANRKYLKINLHFTYANWVKGDFTFGILYSGINILRIYVEIKNLSIKISLVLLFFFSVNNYSEKSTLPE